MQLAGCDPSTQANQSASVITEKLPGYWVRANGLRISDGQFAGEHMLLRFDVDGSFHVIAKGVYPDQFHDAFKAGDPFAGPQSKRGVMAFQWHGRWRLGNDNRLGFNFDLDRPTVWQGLWWIASLDQQVMTLKASGMHDVVFHRYDIEKLRDNDYYMNRIGEADQLDGPNPLAIQQRPKAETEPDAPH